MSFSFGPAPAASSFSFGASTSQPSGMDGKFKRAFLSLHSPFIRSQPSTSAPRHLRRRRRHQPLARPRRWPQHLAPPQPPRRRLADSGPRPLRYQSPLLSPSAGLVQPRRRLRRRPSGVLAVASGSRPPPGRLGASGEGAPLAARLGRRAQRASVLAWEAGCLPARRISHLARRGLHLALVRRYRLPCCTARLERVAYFNFLIFH